MHTRIVLRDVGLCLLIAAIANADQTNEMAFRSTCPSDDSPTHVGCAVVDQSFRNVSCKPYLTINVTAAHYGYHRASQKSCLVETNDCCLSVSKCYYKEILEKCNGKTQCDSTLMAEEFNGRKKCGLFPNYGNDYVLIQFSCVSSSANSTLITGSSEYTSGTPSAVPVTSVAYSNLPSSTTTGSATIASVAPTFTIEDNLGNVSTGVTIDVSQYTSMGVAVEQPADNSTIIIVGSVVFASVVLIIVLLVIIFIVRRKINLEGTSTGRGNNSDRGLNGVSSGNNATMVKCNTPQDVTHGGNKSHVAPTCISDSIGMPTHSLTNPPNTDTSDLTHMYSLAQELSTAVFSLAARERGADLYSEVMDTGFRSLAQQPNIACYSLVQKSEEGFHRDIKQSNAVIYVNMTEMSESVYSTEQQANPRTFPKVGDPGRGAHLRVKEPEFEKIKFKAQEQDLPSQTRSQFGDQSNDLILRDNSLYGVADTPSQNYADELTLTDNSLYECNATYT